MNENIKVSIVDDHEMVVQGLSALINQYSGIEVIQTYNSGFNIIEDYLKLKPDVILMDINMPAINGFETSKKIINIDPDAKIIMISMEINRPYVNKAYEEGVKGYVSKSADIEELINTIKKVYVGETAFYNYLEVSKN